VSSVVNVLFSDGREDNAFYAMNWDGADVWEGFDTLALLAGRTKASVPTHKLFAAYG
jgi:hypothetical protein